MTAQTQLFQPVLPSPLLSRLSRIRSRYKSALEAARQGDYAQAEMLRSATRRVGHLLAEEARKSPEERGGLRMLDISLAVDRLFPELRGWTQYEALQQQRERLQTSGLGTPFLPRQPRRRAS